MNNPNQDPTDEVLNSPELLEGVKKAHKELKKENLLNRDEVFPKEEED